MDLYHAVAAETGKQVALGGVVLEVRQVGENLIIDDFFQFLHPVLVLYPGAHGAAARPVEDVVVFQGGLALAAHEWRHSFVQHLQVFVWRWCARQHPGGNQK